VKLNSLITVLLWSLVLCGFVSVAKVSLNNFNGDPCASVYFLPVCYVVTAAYSLILASLMIKHSSFKDRVFSIGWGVAFTIGWLGSLVEIIGGGGICPSNSGGLQVGYVAGIPLCFISLAMLLLILVLFLKSRRLNKTKIV